jgi:protein-S-isoprenylcysteine O-methyltransferase Ste14
MRCDGLHCDGCRHGGGPAGVGAAVVVLAVFIAVGLHKFWAPIVSALEIAAWTLVSIAGTAAVVTGTVITTKAVRARRARREVTAGEYRPGYRIIPGAVLDDRAALGQPRRHPAPGSRQRHPARRPR